MIMKNLFFALVVALSSAALTTNTFAQGKTRSQVRQELIEAQKNGLNFVTDSSYPDVNPIYRQQVAQLKMLHSGSGPATAGTSDAGQSAEVSTDHGHTKDIGKATRSSATPADSSHAGNECVGPAGFCNPYFGS
jgi:4-diphosphocytidyl-2C-methyl-D-erythritol kinase